MIVFLCVCVSSYRTGLVCKIVLCVCVGSFYFPPLALNPFFEQAADSSLDYYLDFHSFTEHHLSFVLSLLPARYPSFSGIILFSLPVVHDAAT